MPDGIHPGDASVLRAGDIRRQVSMGSPSSFSWPDAAFGAAGMLVLIGLGAGTALAVRRGVVMG